MNNHSREEIERQSERMSEWKTLKKEPIIFKRKISLKIKITWILLWVKLFETDDITPNPYPQSMIIAKSFFPCSIFQCVI